MPWSMLADVAFVEVQVSVDLPRLAMLTGTAVSVTLTVVLSVSQSLLTANEAPVA